MNNIELVEEFLSKKNLDGIDKFLLEKYIKAVGNILNYIKDLEYKLKEKICFEGHQQFKELKENSIPKQVIRDKIEELDKEYNKKVNEVYKNPTEALIEFQRVVGAKKILEELLESEE